MREHFRAVLLLKRKFIPWDVACIAAKRERVAGCFPGAGNQSPTRHRNAMLQGLLQLQHLLERPRTKRDEAAVQSLHARSSAGLRLVHSVSGSLQDAL